MSEEQPTEHESIYDREQIIGKAIKILNITDKTYVIRYGCVYESSLKGRRIGSVRYYNTFENITKLDEALRILIAVIKSYKVQSNCISESLLLDTVRKDVSDWFADYLVKELKVTEETRVSSKELNTIIKLVNEIITAEFAFKHKLRPVDLESKLVKFERLNVEHTSTIVLGYISFTYSIDAYIPAPVDVERPNILTCITAFEYNPLKILREASYQGYKEILKRKNIEITQDGHYTFTLKFSGGPKLMPAEMLNNIGDELGVYIHDLIKYSYHYY